MTVCDVCQTRRASVIHGCVELCSTCAVDELLARRRHEDEK